MTETEMVNLKAISFVNRDEKRNISILDNLLKIETDSHKTTCISYKHFSLPLENINSKGFLKIKKGKRAD